MRLESSAFTDEGMIPREYTCDGGHRSPPLVWSEVPEGVESFVLLMDDPDAAAVIGKTFDHWVLYDLPATVRELPAGLPGDRILPNEGIHGVTTRNAYGYFGPCPPPGTLHRYIFSLYAIDRCLGLEPGKTKDEILQAIEGHILDRISLIGLYTK
jgi:Raf kinase inhibitor-like YbhB/YbcL family protein